MKRPRSELRTLSVNCLVEPQRFHQASPLRHTKKPAFAGSGDLTCRWQNTRGMIRRCAAHPSRGPLATFGRCAFPPPTSSASGRTSGFSPGFPSPPYKKTRFRGFFCMAEREGFEPSIGSYPMPVFKTGAFNRSATSPFISVVYYSYLIN